MASGSIMANDCATWSFAEIFLMMAELLVIVTLPSFMSYASVVIQSWVELLASRCGAMRHLPSVMCEPGFVVRVIDSPGFTQVLEGGACSRTRLWSTLFSGVVMDLACGDSVTLQVLLVM